MRVEKCLTFICVIAYSHALRSFGKADFGISSGSCTIYLIVDRNYSDLIAGATESHFNGDCTSRDISSFYDKRA